MVKRRSLLVAAAAVATVLVRGLAGASPGWQAQQSPPPSQPPIETAAERFKNLQVLGDIPAEELPQTMHFFRASLGVHCDYCHVTEGQHYERDDRPAKAKARQMIRLVRRLNAEQFDGKPVVTCNTCHRGSVSPEAVPTVAQGLFPDTTHTPALPVPPTAAAVLDRYIEALGGRKAMESVCRRVSTGVLLEIRIDHAGTAQAVAVNRGRQVSLEMVQNLDGTAQVRIGEAESDEVLQIVGRDGGTVSSQQLNRALTEQELARLRAELDLRRDLALRARAESMSVSTGLLDGKAVDVLEGTGADGRLRRWYFDQESGLLLRRIVLTEMALGADPEQTDYEDYRDVDGVKVPFTVKRSFLDDNHLGTTRRFSSIQDFAGDACPR